MTVVEKAPQILPPFDPDMARLVAYHFQEKYVELIVGDGIKGFHQNRELAQEAELESGKRLPMDFAILSIGVRPELKLAREAGLKSVVRRDFRQRTATNIPTPISMRREMLLKRHTWSPANEREFL